MKRGGSSSLRQPAAMEKERRDQMKELYTRLASLLQLQSYVKFSPFCTICFSRHTEGKMPLLDLLDQATMSLKQWKGRVERLKAQKGALENECRGASSNEHNLQVVRVSETDSHLEVNLIINSNYRKVELFRVLSIIEEGGAEVLGYNFSFMAHQTHCTIHAQAFQTRLGFDSSLIEHRLKQLVF